MSFPGRFRVWDKKYKKFQDIKVFKVGGDGKLNNFHDEMIISWSTGLFDKNGKEIFEGDICRHTHPRNPEYSYGVGIIEYHDGGFWPNRTPFDPKGEAHYLEYNGDFFNNEECEVLGNIYENPELLK